MKRNKMISAAMCAVMFATSTVLYVSAAPKYNTAPASVQSEHRKEDSNSYTLIELMGTDDWEIFFNYVYENKGIFVKKYSEELDAEKAIYVDPDNIDAQITLTSGEYTLVDREGNVIPHKPCNFTFSVYSHGGNNGGQVISKFFFSMVKGPASEKRGDVNNDGTISLTDAVKVAAHIKGVSLLQDDKQKYRADVNNDGKISITDVISIAAHIKGIKKIV